MKERYEICCKSTMLQTKDAKTAIVKWFELSENNPTEVCICAKTKEDAKELLETAIKMPNLNGLWMIYNNIYKYDYLISEINKGIENNCRGYQFEYDQVHPFDLG